MASSKAPTPIVDLVARHPFAMGVDWFDDDDNGSPLRECLQRMQSALKSLERVEPMLSAPPSSAELRRWGMVETDWLWQVGSQHFVALVMTRDVFIRMAAEVLAIGVAPRHVSKDLVREHIRCDKQLREAIDKLVGATSTFASTRNAHVHHAENPALELLEIEHRLCHDLVAVNLRGALEHGEAGSRRMRKLARDAFSGAIQRCRADRERLGVVLISALDALDATRRRLSPQSKSGRPNG